MSDNDRMAYAVFRSRGLPALEAYLFARHPDLEYVVRPNGTGYRRSGWWLCNSRPTNYDASLGLHPSSLT